MCHFLLKLSCRQFLEQNLLWLAFDGCSCLFSLRNVLLQNPHISSTVVLPFEDFLMFSAIERICKFSILSSDLSLLIWSTCSFLVSFLPSLTDIRYLARDIV